MRNVGRASGACRREHVPTRVLRDVLQHRVLLHDAQHRDRAGAVLGIHREQGRASRRTTRAGGKQAGNENGRQAEERERCCRRKDGGTLVNCVGFSACSPALSGRDIGQLHKRSVTGPFLGCTYLTPSFCNDKVGQVTVSLRQFGRFSPYLDTWRLERVRPRAYLGSTMSATSRRM